MTLEQFLTKLNVQPEQVEFTDTMAAIEAKTDAELKGQSVAIEGKTEAKLKGMQTSVEGQMTAIQGAGGKIDVM